MTTAGWSAWRKTAHICCNTCSTSGTERVKVERQPLRDRESPPSGLGPVAGLVSRLAISTAKGGLNTAAKAVSAGLSPPAGAVTAKAVEQVNSDLIHSAASDSLAETSTTRPFQMMNSLRPARKNYLPNWAQKFCKGSTCVNDVDLDHMNDRTRFRLPGPCLLPRA
ncbi:hypothetical protein [Streptomyces resistomycificus]|uniref:hypothetical protein n=1 Tax=Streptomyces resistomycificus TaxID=67356 RepID=UPI000FE20B21|nr:hypothetical protein [Streptomyces resistomycificus]